MIFFETVELKTLNYRRQVRAQISFARQNIYLFPYSTTYVYGNRLSCYLRR